ncbi:hypothetical protein LIER_23229 [Lithospermum erythrorhizon]|uniref:Uncharacterized protein n=1 Tax=Lithospermum erythrorhizon TaxID=34254 RepID=A0AAV3R040_LITER
MAHLEEEVQASLYVYDCSDAVMKVSCELSVLTSVGELSLSLWDLYKLGGLLVKGQIFDEAYHRLSLSSANGRVLITDWINNWSESPRVYVGPQAAGASGGKTSSLVGCPKGTILPHCDWDSRDWKIFEQLGICAGLAEETYCVTFLSCWLCLFVHPLEPHGYMRVSIFKMASCMDTGTVCFTYVSPCSFPAHYVFDLMDTYLHNRSGVTTELAGSHMAKYGGLSRSRPCDSVAEARGRLDNCHPGWTALKPRQSASFIFYDHKPQSYEDVNFFLSLRTNMLGFHFGDQFDVEVYHPHRFSRQLGFTTFHPGC